MYLFVLNFRCCGWSENLLWNLESSQLICNVSIQLVFLIFADVNVLPHLRSCHKLLEILAILGHKSLPLSHERVLLTYNRFIVLQFNLANFEDFRNFAQRLLSNEVNCWLLPQIWTQIRFALAIFNAFYCVAIEHLDILFYLVMRGIWDLNFYVSNRSIFWQLLRSPCESHVLLKRRHFHVTLGSWAHSLGFNLLLPADFLRWKCA